MVLGVCLEAMLQLCGGCGEAVSRVWGKCLEGMGKQF